MTTSQSLKFRHGSLFSGIGGFDLAAEWMGWTNVFHCELNPFGRKILKHHFPNSTSYEDITKTDFSIYRGKLDVLTGGFPCQDASNANQSETRGSGSEGERTGLISHMLRAIDEIRPNYIVAENVANILQTNEGKDFGRILDSVAAMGYNAEWRIMHASEKGAPHKRARCFLVIYSDRVRLQEGQTFLPYVQEKVEPFGWSFARTTVSIFRGGAWKDKPPLLLLDDGLPSGLHQEGIKAYGNSIVPQLAFGIFESIDNLHYGNDEK